MSTIPAALFDEHYRSAVDGDPFRYNNNRFELTKYYAQLSLLVDRRYARALELACSIGIFTGLLAGHCDDLLAVDCSQTAVAQARVRCAALDNVRFEVLTVPAAFPAGPFDLVTYAEFGYYLGAADLRRLRERIAAATYPGAHLLLTHMAVDFAEYMDTPIPSRYEDVHGGFEGDPNFRHLTRLKGYDRAGTTDFDGPELYWCDLFERVA